MTLAEVCVPTTCTPPEASANAEGFVSTGTSIEEVWSIECSPGYVVDVAGAIDTRCQKSGERTSPDPVCIEAAGCAGSDELISAVDDAEALGTCEGELKDGDDCALQCATDFVAVGKFLCNNGKLDGILTCLDQASADAAVEVEMMSSAFSLVVDLTGMSEDDIMNLFKGVIATTLGIDQNDVAKVDIASSGRRLAAQRRLQSGYEVAYQAIVPPGQAAAIAAKASGIGSGGAAQDAFLKAFADAGVTVDASSLKVTQAPKTFTATIVRSADGGVKAPAPPPIPTVPPPPTTTPSPTPPPTPPPTPGGSGASSDDGDDDGGNTGAVIGGVVGGVVALGLIGGAAYYFLVVKKKGTE
eukprot:gnl/TRDRNA2_/TRDRNA2_177530_c0_seq3.p1 gnl/TRDRNA2_/TRDRNA2_177530_c0~~gnl/TRDRNA2_/TRDRNA2_177530_c0_seq3.p1  ORF type:complete len:367 (-),score=84.86 gnl/TRDRNA2_/TRDRNA2_177530_c0_seq3:205-1272(-)